MTSTFPSNAAPEVRIDYHPRQHRRLLRVDRRALRWLLVGAAGCAGVIVARSPLPRRAVVPLYAARCASYSAPAAAVVYEEHNGKGLPWSMATASRADRTGTRRYAPAPACVGFFRQDNAEVPEAPAFLGKLRVPGGGEQIVYVTLAASRPAGDAAVPDQLDRAAVARIPGWSAAGQGVDARGWYTGGPDLVEVFSLIDGGPWYRYFANRAAAYRVHAGQRDPADPTRFTLDVDADAQRLRIHGRMRSRTQLDLSVEWIGQRRDAPTPPPAG